MTQPEQSLAVQSLAEWQGRELGERTVSYSERDVMLYALAIGVPASRLDLVYEKQLRVLPTFGLTLAQWAPDLVGAAGAFDPTTAVHGAQKLTVHKPLPSSGELQLRAKVSNIWDKGSAAVIEVDVDCDNFTATWSLFAPGCGGFGGARGPGAPEPPEGSPSFTATVATAANQAALYRLLGDLHPMHIDPTAAQAAGQPRPFLHGLSSLAAATIAIADQQGAHPADLLKVEGRFAAPAFPGEELQLSAWQTPSPKSGTRFAVMAGHRPVIRGGRVVFT